MPLKIDTKTHAGGDAISRRLKGGALNGVPWMIILDAQGRRLVTSDGEKGNIGYPYEPHEIEHFMVMLRATARRLTADQFTAIERALHEDAAVLRK